MSVLIVDGERSKSKIFVKEAEKLGYAVRKINPKKATREVVRIILPRGHEEDDLFFEEANEFLNKNSAYLHYIQKELRDFMADEEEEQQREDDDEEGKTKAVAILVNISKDMRHVLEEEESLFRILVTEKSPENHNGYDRVIETSGLDFSERVESTLRIIQS